LARSYFARGGQVSEVRYSGRAAADALLAHYVRGFTAAGYTQQVILASTEGEQHRFERGKDVIDLALKRKSLGLVDVTLKDSAQ